MFSNIIEANEWVTGLRGVRNSFERWKQIAHEFGDLQNDFYVIHVAGTNGKGSTCNYLTDLLISQGFTVGTITSPHNVVHQDRIRLNNQNIPDADFLRILNDNYEFFVRNDLSMFEIDYLIACVYFREHDIDIWVMEVGLGGCLDSTNVVDTTKLSIITTIGYDHMEKLGNTLPEICSQKCGIIKDHSRCLIGRLDDECKEVVKYYCQLHQAGYYEVREHVDLPDRRFLYRGREYQLGSYAVYQKDNASLALEAFLMTMADLRREPDYAKAAAALAASSWQCRFQIVRENPRVILDGAHNLHGVEALCTSFDQFTGSKCIIFSALQRKEYKAMADLLKKHCDRIIITSFEYEGVMDLKEFAQWECEPDYHKAIKQAMQEYDNVLVCGSLYFMSDVVLNEKFALK